MNKSNKSLIWIAAAVAGLGFGIPAFAAMSTSDNRPVTTTTPTVVSTPETHAGDDSVTTRSSTPSTPVSAPTVISLATPTVVTTADSIEDVSGSCAEAGHATDDRCTGIDASDDTTNATTNSVEDISGPCDEAEHAADARCTGANTSTNAGSGPVTTIDDNSGRGTGGHGGGADDVNHSGHGGGSHG